VLPPARGCLTGGSKPAWVAAAALAAPPPIPQRGFPSRIRVSDKGASVPRGCVKQLSRYIRKWPWIPKWPGFHGSKTQVLGKVSRGAQDLLDAGPTARATWDVELRVRAFPVGNGSAAYRTSQQLSAHRGTSEACRSFTQVSRILPRPFLPRGKGGPDVIFLSEDGHVLNYGSYKDTTSLYN